ncbi:DUF4352 domain-containing protein [Oscillibacter sp. MSJ-2]|uniref:DUF4352 domain-containing protein n=1 Tax=Dysosmobacter acutus TaxID=2841504 RepID=A0ABS6F608_9FIRM|nr:DUF4352 domain-containing protein [Dysosmobacter acutus]MBU5625729.1 DUF4352 domain-containing protein [Dysosmobacter acutus]
MKHRVALLLLALALAVSLAGCGGSGSSGNKGSSSSGASSSGVQVDLRDGVEYEEGGESGYLGDVMHTAFLNFAVTDAYTCPTYGGYTPAEGNQVLVVSVSILNTGISSLPMFDTDFQIQWGSENDEDYGWPITTSEEPWEKQPQSGEALDDNQLPGEYEIGINKERSGLLFFEVPADSKDFSVSFEEFFEDETVGDLYFVYFTAEKKA